MKAPARLTDRQRAFLDDPDLALIFTLIESAGGEIRVNGGAVRNALLGETVGEVDLSTSLTPQQVMETLEENGLKTVATGIDHGTITAVSNGKGFEITTLREDIETDGRRAIVRFGTDWTADARRRDFTMNALYCDREGTIYDPLGGYGDLVARRIRFIGNADDRITEDYLRILRFFRFFAWYGTHRPDQDSLKACVRHRDSLPALSAERIWSELKKLLSAPDPTRAVLWMRTTKVLSIVLPESEKWGADLLPALTSTCAEAGREPDPLLRLMAIIPPREERIETLAARLKLSNAEAGRLRNWVEAKDPPLNADPPELERQLYRQDRQAVLDHLTLEYARLSEKPDVNKALEELNTRIEFVRNWKKPAFPLKGRDLLDSGHSAGPQLGNMLSRLEEEWIQSGFSLSKPQLLQRAGQLN